MKSVILPDRVAPPDAKTVDDLCALVAVGEQVTFRRTSEPAREQSHFVSVRMTGEAINDTMAHIEFPQRGLKKGQERIGIGEDEPLSNYSDTQVSFDYGDPRLVGDLADNRAPLMVLSDRLFEFIEEHDPNSLEAIPLAIPSYDSGRILRFWLARPRMLDAVDIERTNVTIQRHATADSGRSFTVVEYETTDSPPAFFVRRDLPSNVMHFREKHWRNGRQGWVWRVELFERAQEAGFWGFAARTLVQPHWSLDIPLHPPEGTTGR